ncbi:autotransporter domain-containing protein [Bosea sp. Tri-39]|uniref:autotransporter outer membrane beta-barrel domain-containing protein n=1 Tax=Bosea sp. Tri-39 TaxID=1867714 RepID=UPI0013E97885|nr:autotransporter domain-containing protein [Bosea sp. Tri-39]
MRLALLLGVSVTAFAAGSPALTQAAEWLGATGDFNLNSNWTGGAVPTNGTATFTNSPTAVRNVTVTTDNLITSIQYNSNALAYTLSMTPNHSLVVQAITNNSSVEQTLIAAAGGAIAIGGTVTGATTLIATVGSFVIFSGPSVSAAGSRFIGQGGSLSANTLSIGSIEGNGSIDFGALSVGSLNSDTTYAGRIDIGVILTKVGTGALTLSGANVHAGGTTIGAGSIVAANDAAFGTGLVTLNGGTLSTTGARTIGNNISLTSSSAIRVLDTTATFSGAIATGGHALSLEGSGNGTISGAISGSGTVTKSGTGTFTLSGVNSYTGATLVNAGTLLAGAAGSLAPSSALTLATGASLDLNGFNQAIGSIAGAGAVTLGAATLSTGSDNGGTTFAGVLSGTGSLTKVGTGAFTLAGANTYTGATMVTGGVLIVNGSIASSSGVTVAAGATLGGSGQLPSLTVNGTLAPGNSPGTLTVNGNLVLGAGSLYLAEVQGAVSDRINVSGTAALGGTLRIVPLGGAYLFSTPYTLLAAAGGRSGTFGTVDTTGSFGDGVTSAVSYTSNDVQLTLTPKPLAPIIDPVVPPFVPSAPSPRLGVGRPANAYAVASAIDAAVANGADPSGLFGIYNLPATAIPAAVNQLSGEVHTAAPAVANSAAGQFLGTMLDGSETGRLAGSQNGPGGAAGFTADLPSRQGGPGRSTLDPTRFSLWGATFSSTGRNDGDRAVGSANRNLSDAHLAVGVDIRLGSNTVAGIAVAGGQSRASLSGSLGKAEADVFQAGLHGRTTLGTVNLAAALGYARLDTDTTRAIPALGRTGVTASYATQAWSGRVEASLPVANWGGLTLSPLAAFQAVRASSPVAIEGDGTGAAAGALTLAGRSDMTSRSELGLQLDANLLAGATPVTGFVRAAWAHYYQRDADLAASLNGLPGASFAAIGARADRNTALLAAGADIRLSQSVSLGMRVDSELSGNTRRIGGTAQLRVRF